MCVTESPSRCAPGRRLSRWVIAGVWILVACQDGPSLSHERGEGGDSEEVRVVRAQVDAFNRHSAQDLSAGVSDDFVWLAVEESGVRVEAEGRTSLRESMEGYFAALPSVRSEIEELLVSGRFVALRERVTWTGPDGNEQTQAALAVYEVEDGEIRRVWYYPSEP